jgi:hypothetical protein
MMMMTSLRLMPLLGTTSVPTEAGEWWGMRRRRRERVVHHHRVSQIPELERVRLSGGSEGMMWSNTGVCGFVAGLLSTLVLIVTSKHAVEKTSVGKSIPGKKRVRESVTFRGRLKETLP